MSLFDNPKQDKPKQFVATGTEPLGTRMRPQRLDEYAGQQHVIGKGKLLYRMIKAGTIRSIILYGPPSSGKTTLANVISNEIDARFITLNAVLDGIKELRAVVDEAKTRARMQDVKTILFVDEIHRWNKAQQDALLPHIESGLLTLIGATTENPYYSLVGPLLSRCQLFELYPFDIEEIKNLLLRALKDDVRGLAKFNVDLKKDALEHFSSYAAGDIRYALNALETAVITTPPNDKGGREITLQIAKDSIQKRNVRFDKTGDEHYHFASAFIKSMRGSEPDASLHWMCSLIEGGEDPNFIFRRLLIFASEDVGMAEPKAVDVVNACHSAFEKCGMPEGLYFLSHACIYLAICPKSNSTKAIFKALNHIKTHGTGRVPEYLKDKTANKLKSFYSGSENPSDSYKYPHDYPNNWVEQSYNPIDTTELNYYKPGMNPIEQKFVIRLNKIKDVK